MTNSRMVKVYEDNGGGIHAVVMEGEQIINIISGFEDGTIGQADFIEAAKLGFPDAYDYDADDYSGLPMEDVAAEMEDEDELIAKITPDFVELYPGKMGCAGMDLFGVESDG